MTQKPQGPLVTTVPGPALAPTSASPYAPSRAPMALLGSQHNMAQTDHRGAR